MVEQIIAICLFLFLLHLNVSADVLCEETKVISGKKAKNFWKYFFYIFKVLFLCRDLSVLLHGSYDNKEISQIKMENCVALGTV